MFFVLEEHSLAITRQNVSTCQRLPRENYSVKVILGREASVRLPGKKKLCDLLRPSLLSLQTQMHVTRAGENIQANLGMDSLSVLEVMS